MRKKHTASVSDASLFDVATIGRKPIILTEKKNFKPYSQ
jgi:hypothetical protein